ncbi:C6 finger domain [Mycena sanguinolenta]|uniref:C6 finger domain n=1 Tax=Mycena sanguinolenta TaxID=230812 RepID=A0A8H7CLA5_9AGAR|nr:C6 finger domain [Mycena sanguinolenta]
MPPYRTEPSSLVFYPPAFQTRRRVCIACTMCRKRKIRCLTPEDPPINACHRCTKKGLHCEYIPIAMQRDQSSTHENDPTISSSPVSPPPPSPPSTDYFPDGYNQTTTFPTPAQFHPYLDPVRDFAPRRTYFDEAQHVPVADAGEYSRKSEWEICAVCPLGSCQWRWQRH